jgi:predicted nucleotidyltransferase
MVEELREALAADPRIAYALLFGSHARGTAHAGSDVDLAIGILPGTVLTPLDLGQLVSKLEAVASARAWTWSCSTRRPPALAFRTSSRDSS